MTNLISEPVDKQLQIEYETNILSMLLGGKANKQEHILKHTCAEMFTTFAYQELYKTIENLYKNKQPINIGNLCEIAKKEHIKKLGIELNREFITSANCDYYLEKLLNHYLKKLLKECESFSEYKKVEEIRKKYEIM